MKRVFASPNLTVLLAAALVFLATGRAAEKRQVSALANSDPNYTSLRNIAPGESRRVSGLTLKRDIGIFELSSGTVTFSKPVLGRVVMAVFQGEGEFSLRPTLSWEINNLRLFFDSDAESRPEVREKFRRLVLCFTDDTYQEIQKNSEAATLDSSAAEILKRFRDRVRKNRERPRSRLEAILQGEDVDNVEADLLADLYNPNRRGAFNAYIFGEKFNDLRFFVRPRGALPQILSPEEVGLVNFSPGGDREGIWYLAHFAEEHKSGKADSREDHSTVDALSFRIQTRIQKNKKIDARCQVRFRAVASGERVIKFSLLPELRVFSVQDAGGNAIRYIQEDKRADGSFYVILPEPTEKDREYTLRIEYFGEDVIRDAGGGNFSIGARTSWYPSLGNFKDRALYHLIFDYPKRYQLVSVGKLIEEKKLDKNFKRSEWRSETPLAVAGFNYGDYKKKVVTDQPTSYSIEGWATSKVPDFLRSVGATTPTFGSSSVRSTRGALGTLSPKAMMNKTMGEAQISIRLFTKYFGPLPYGRIAITQQPQFGSGQSWPSLLYLPVSAFLDSTQRWALLGRYTFNFSRFVQEVTAHEVAHQWWGHIVGWASYHDQWLSEGFADFSSSLFIQATQKNPQKYYDFLRHWTKNILEKNNFGFRANDVGPLWMGTRLITPRTGAAYRKLIYPKGGYVLHMLRWMMYDPKTGDQLFIAMMKDFVKTHYNRNASTEDFQAIVEKHMTLAMDMEGNRRMDWFFRQWVYGNEVPSYTLSYKLTPSGSGVHLSAKIVQSGVSDSFGMPVPIYVQYGANRIRLARVGLTGNTESSPIEIDLPQRPDRVLLNGNHDILTEKIQTNEL